MMIVVVMIDGTENYDPTTAQFKNSNLMQVVHE